MELPSIPPIKGIFVTGTDTGVGKTWITAGIAAVWRRWGLKAAYFKPVQSGCPEEGGRLIPTDARFARDLAGLEEPLEFLTPLTLRLPLAPGVAAVQEGVSLDWGRVAAALEELTARYDFFAVEGAGGLYVPLDGNRFLVLDLIRWLHLPLLVVARAGLGAINHTALTVMAARHAGLAVAGVILNRYPPKPGLAEQTNPEVIQEITQVPILGKISEVEDINLTAGREGFLAQMDAACRSLEQACAARAFLECMV
ncbi:MAG: dethiobiotin synthase [Deltaproteobacteria bacterium]|nr:dethiobiotin synthase [Deltaproteobacteria bacterium]